MRQASGDYTKIDFLANFQAIHDRAFTKSTIISAWQKTGLFPYDPSIVLDRLARYQRRDSPAREITSEPQQVPDLEEWPTPYTHRQVTQYGKELQDLYPSDQTLDRYIRGAEAKMLSGLLAERELDAVQQAAVSRAARKAESNAMVQKGGVIYSHEARSKVAARKETDVEKAQKALDWANSKESRAHNALRNKKIKCFKAAARKARELTKIRLIKKAEIDRDSI